MTTRKFSKPETKRCPLSTLLMANGLGHASGPVHSHPTVTCIALVTVCSPVLKSGIQTTNYSKTNGHFSKLSMAINVGIGIPD